MYLIFYYKIYLLINVSFKQRAEISFKISKGSLLILPTINKFIILQNYIKYNKLFLYTISILMKKRDAQCLLLICIAM